MQKLPIFRNGRSADVQSPSVGKGTTEVMFLDEQVDASQRGGVRGP